MSLFSEYVLLCEWQRGAMIKNTGFETRTVGFKSWLHLISGRVSGNSQKPSSASWVWSGDNSYLKELSQGLLVLV